MGPSLLISRRFLTLISNVLHHGIRIVKQYVLKGGSDPEVTIGTKRVCGGQRATQTGVAPALFMTPRAVLSSPRLVSEFVFSHLFTDDNRRTVHDTASRTKPTMGMVR